MLIMDARDRAWNMFCQGICDELKVRLRGAQEAWQSVMIVMWAYLTPELFSFAHEQGSGIECNVGIFVPGPESLSQT